MDEELTDPISGESAREAATGDVPLALPYAGGHDPQSTLARTTPGDLACLAVKIIGFYTVVLSLPTLAILAELVLGHDTSIRTGMACVSAAVYIGAGLFLIFKATAIAQWLLPRTALITTAPPSSAPAQLHAMALSVVGLVFCVRSVPMFVLVLVRVAVGNPKSSIQPELQTRLAEHFASLLSYGVEAALGIWLFYGSKRLSTWWWSLRHTEFREATADGGNIDRDSNQS